MVVQLSQAPLISPIFFFELALALKAEPKSGFSSIALLKSVAPKNILYISVTFEVSQKLKFLQISLQYLLPRLKHQYNENEEPIAHTVNIVRTTHGLERLKKVEKYEAENNVKIL